MYDHEKSEDLEFARALLKLDIHIENVAGPDGLLMCDVWCCGVMCGVVV